MSDAALNRFLARGTTTDRLAFTPSPPTPASGPDHAYLWFDTDLSAYYSWNGASWDPAVIPDGTVTNAKLDDMADATVKGRAAGAGTGVPTDLSASDLAAILGTKYAVISFEFHGNGSDIAANSEVDFGPVPEDCEIVEVTLLADAAGDIEVDLYVDDVANFPPDGSDSIVDVTPPTLSGADNSQDSTLTDWTTALTAGQTIRAHVNSCTGIERATLTLKVALA